MNRDKKSLEKRIAKEEKIIYIKKQALAKLRRKLPPTEFEDFKLTKSDGKATSLSKLFGDHQELIVVHNMGKDCPYCSLWADAFNGVIKHLENRLAFAVESPDAPAVQAKAMAKQNWQFTMVSSQGSKFRKVAGFEKNREPQPGFSIFVKNKNGVIYQASKNSGTIYFHIADFFELLPDGLKGWQPQLKYLYEKGLR